MIVSVNGKNYTVEDEEKFTVEAVEKGTNKIKIHRARVPQETEDFHEVDTTDFAGNMQKKEQSPHTQFDSIFDVNINSSKAVLVVKTKVVAKDKLGMDTIFSSYSLEVSGAKIENECQVFANERVRKKFISHHLKNAFVPVGFGGIAILLMGIYALLANIRGEAINLGGREFTYPWSIGLMVIGFGFLFYAIFVTVRVLTLAKKYKT